jgi:hypothetical protein
LTAPPADPQVQVSAALAPACGVRALPQADGPEPVLPSKTNAPAQEVAESACETEALAEPETKAVLAHETAGAAAPAEHSD